MSGCRVAATHMSWEHVHAGSTPATRTISSELRVLRRGSSAGQYERLITSRRRCKSCPLQPNFWIASELPVIRPERPNHVALAGVPCLYWWEGISRQLWDHCNDALSCFTISKPHGRGHRRAVRLPRLRCTAWLG